MVNMRPTVLVQVTKVMGEMTISGRNVQQFLEPPPVVSSSVVSRSRIKARNPRSPCKILRWHFPESADEWYDRPASGVSRSSQLRIWDEAGSA